MSETDKMHLEEVNLKAYLDEYLKTNSRQVKRDLIKIGHIHQISFYGAVRRRSTDTYEGRRFEVFSNEEYKGDDVKKIRMVLEEIKPPYHYSIWLYNPKRRTIKVVAKYGPRTY